MTNAITIYGDSEEIVNFAKRIKDMVPGGKNLQDSEARALAQVSIVTDCNPFIGEVWYIPGKGPMIGIRGARRHGNKQTKEAGGKDAYWESDFSPCSAEEAGYKGDIKNLAAAWKCVITDSVSSAMFQKLFLETVTALRAGGSNDPVGEAREICGKRPQWVGYGFSTESEPSKMNKQALAKKRAESDALKRKFDIPFGATIAAGDDYSEAEPEDVDVAFPKTEAIEAEIKAEVPVTVTAPLVRPYSPADLKKRIAELAHINQKGNKISATAKQRGLMINVLTEIFAPIPDSADHAESVIRFFTDNHYSSKDLPGMYVNAVLDWMKPVADTSGTYFPDSIAIKEAELVLQSLGDK